jgi:CRP-like cAMP-binding protein
MSIQVHARVSAENLLLAQLPVHERNAVLRGSRAVSCTPGDVLLNADTHSDYVFFPVDMVVSTIRTLRDGRSIDVGLVGCEGMVGLDVFADERTQHDESVVQIAGTAYCMPADDLRKQFYRRGTLQQSLLRFTNAFLSQVAQNALCSRFHSLEARVSRWLLMVHERSALPEICNTPGSVARALGATDDETDNVLTRLASGKAIRHRRHSIHVIEPQRLELTACECYET